MVNLPQGSVKLAGAAKNGRPVDLGVDPKKKPGFPEKPGFWESRASSSPSASPSLDASAAAAHNAHRGRGGGSQRWFLRGENHQEPAPREGSLDDEIRSLAR